MVALRDNLTKDQPIRDAERAHRPNGTFLEYLRRAPVTGILDSVGSTARPYSPECVGGKFSNLHFRPDGVLRSSTDA